MRFKAPFVFLFFVAMFPTSARVQLGFKEKTSLRRYQTGSNVVQPATQNIDKLPMSGQIEADNLISQQPNKLCKFIPKNTGQNGHFGEEQTSLNQKILDITA